MTEYENLLSIAKLAVQEAIKLLAEEMTNYREEFVFCDDLPREMKAEAKASRKANKKKGL